MLTKVLISSALALAAMRPTVAAADEVVGGWTSVEITQNITDVLSQALSNDTSYLSSVSTRLCVAGVYSVQEQVVSGTNYLFEMQGCAVDAVVATGVCDSCTSPEDYKVEVYEQTWTDTVQVTSITLSSNSSSASGGSVTAGSGSNSTAAGGSSTSGAPSAWSFSAVAMLSAIALQQLA